MELDYVDVDLMPFTRIIWLASTSPDIAKEIVSLPQEVNRAEIMTVAEGIRKCATTHLWSRTMKEDLEKILDLGLYFLPLRKVKRLSG